MSQILNRFSLEAAKFNGQIFGCLLIIWIAMVVCAIVSINSQHFSERRRWMWIWIVTGIPLFGLLAYLPFSVRREDLPHLFLMAIQKEQRAKKIKKVAAKPGGRTV